MLHTCPALRLCVCHHLPFLRGPRLTTTGQGSQQLIAEFEALRTAVECQTSAVQNQTSLLKEFMADHSSQTIDASKVTAEEIEAIQAALGAKRVYLSNTSVEQLEPDKLRYRWIEGAAEDDSNQIAAVLAWLEENLLRGELHMRYAVIDINRASTAAFPKASFAGLPRHYRGRADYLVLERRHEHLKDAASQRSVALMVLEVKKQLHPDNLPQALLGFFTYGAFSNVALLYVLTDLVNGGVLFWAKQEEQALQVFQEPVAGMDQLLLRMRTTLCALPDKVTGGGSRSRPLPCQGNVLEEPSRQKFSISGLQHPRLLPGQLVLQAFNKLATASSDEQDLKAWYPSDAAQEPLVFECERGAEAVGDWQSLPMYV